MPVRHEGLRVGIDFGEDANLGEVDGLDDEELDENEELDGEDEEDEDGDMANLVDILDILDGKAEADNSSDSESADDTRRSVQRADGKDEVSGGKRKAPHDTNGGIHTDSRTHKRRLIAERTESGVENEFRAQASGMYVCSFIVCCGFPELGHLR
jgi:U3 small nucleolar RNA-associated protein 14